jgi:ferritin-like metal-binding protein YciE
MDEKARETITKYLGDLRALEDHGNQAMARQMDDLRGKNHPEAIRAIEGFKRTLDNHIRHIDARLTALGGSPTSPVKDVVAGAAGIVAGIYGSLRNEAAGKALRDDYAFLSLDTISYLMLHTTALALADAETASLCDAGYRDCARMVVEIDRIMPSTLVQELRQDGFTAKDVAGDSHRLIDQSWQSRSGAGVATPRPASKPESVRTV